MNEVKCECGHVNPIGTVLCEACGRVLDEETKEQKLVDMRYEGTARRSQTYNKTIIDKIWNFFSSVKVGVWLIVLTLIASGIGTIFPQEMYIPPTVPAELHYEEEYGWAGKLYYELGFHNLYSSWWYLILVASIGISLVICSLDRVIPLYRALKTQRVDRHEGFLKRQRVFGITDEADNVDFETIKTRLKERRFNVREENGALLAEKGRFSRWGPYVNHIGLIIFLLGAMLRFVPGMYVDKILWIREGETKEIPGTEGQYYLKSDKFHLDVYDKEKDDKVFEAALEKKGSVVKNFQTDVTLYERSQETLPGEEADLIKIKDHEIRVNQPLKHDSYALYQVDYKLNEFNKMSFKLTRKSDGKEYGDLTIDLYNPKERYDLGNGYVVELKKYLPDFEFDENGVPSTKSRIPNNPAFVFNMITPDKPKGEISFAAIGQNVEAGGGDDNIYKMKFNGIEYKNVSALTVRKDETLWFLGLGGAIFMIGVIQGAYWNHRRIWIQRRGQQVWIAAHTNKNWYGLKKDISNTINDLGLSEPNDQVQEEKST